MKEAFNLYSSCRNVEIGRERPHGLSLYSSHIYSTNTIETLGVWLELQVIYMYIRILTAPHSVDWESHICWNWTKILERPKSPAPLWICPHIAWMPEHEEHGPLQEWHIHGRSASQFPHVWFTGELDWWIDKLHLCCRNTRRWPSWEEDEAQWEVGATSRPPRRH